MLWTWSGSSTIERADIRGSSEAKGSWNTIWTRRRKLRVHLAKTLKTGANLLMLDEPTNDLDVETLRALEEALLRFAGSVMVISHDRWFLDRIATHMLAFEGDSHVEWFEGNHADYEADRRRRLGERADRPHRVTYRRLH